MKNEYKIKLLQIFNLSFDDKNSEELLNIVTIKEIPSRTLLLSEGDIAKKLFIIINGCMRSYFIKDNGSEITSQFFIEGQMVMSFESAITEKPSRQYIDTIENSIIGLINLKDINEIVNKKSSVKEYFNKYLISRLIYYMNQQSSFILDKPEKRYLNLIKENPELVSRLPQQYIASYLGITPVSLSRIRTKIQKQINNC